MDSKGLINFGASLTKELGLWLGVAVSIITGLLWCIPYVLVYGLGSGHTSDTMEGALMVCLILSGISFLAAILFCIGAIKNTVSTDDGHSIPMIMDDGGDTESV